MPSVLRSLLPWILFMLLIGHSASSKELAAIVALVSHLILNQSALRKGFVLDVGGLVFFLLYALNLFVVRYSPVIEYGMVISTAVLAMLAWLSLMLGKPFTLQYARLSVPLEISQSSLFYWINSILTAIWALLLSLMVLPYAIQWLDPAVYSVDLNLGVTVLLMILGVWITKHFPDWLANEMLEKRFRIDIIKQYFAAKLPQKDFTTFNAEALVSKPDKNVEVVIVGAGPVGLASGLLLQQHGIDCLIVEKHSHLSMHPKARAISCRSMELLRKLGIENDVKAHGLPKNQHWFGWFSTLSGQLYGQVFPTNEYGEISPCEPANVAQPFLENVMLARYQKQGGVILFNHEVLTLAQDEHRCQISVKDRTHQTKKVLQSQYLIAADGAHSTLQRLFNIPMVGPKQISVNCSVYCELNLEGILDEDKRFGIAFVLRQDGRPVPMVLAIDGRNRWVFIFPGGGIPQATMARMMTDDYVKNRICDLVGRKDIAITILSKQIWSLDSQVATQLSAGRTFFAGDSVHRFSPTGGMGMNTGLQDADNLAWKLAYAIQGKAKPSLLSTYTKERLPSILNNMQWSLNNLYRIIKIQKSLQGKSLDNADVQMLVQEQALHLNKSGLDLGVIYESKIIAKAAFQKPILAPERYYAHTYPGARLPHFTLMKDQQMISSLDLVSTEFTFLCYAVAKRYAKGIDFKSIATRRIVVDEGITEVKPKHLQNLMGLGEFGALWIRPDGHIAWQGCLNQEAQKKRLMQIINNLCDA